MSVSPLVHFVNAVLPPLVPSSALTTPAILSPSTNQTMEDIFSSHTSSPMQSATNTNSQSLNTKVKRKPDSDLKVTNAKVKKNYHETTNTTLNHHSKCSAERVSDQNISSINRSNHPILLDALEKKEPCNDDPSLSLQHESRYSGHLSTYFSLNDAFKIQIRETTSHLPKILQREGNVNWFWMLLQDLNVLNGKCELILQDPARGNPILEIEVKNGLPILIKGQISTTDATYVGEFSMNHYEFAITGKGKLTCKNGLTESGYWENGVLRNGISTFRNHQLPLSIIYTGKVVDYFWQERTEVRFPSGDRFLGKEMPNHHFTGKLVTTQGGILLGEFSKKWSLINGSCSYEGVRPPTNPVFNGTLVHGKIMRNSQVEILYPNGASLTGRFSSESFSGKDVLEEGRLESMLGIPGYTSIGKFAIEADGYFPILIQGKAVYDNSKPSRIVMVGEVDNSEGKLEMKAILPDGEQIALQKIELKEWIGQRKNVSNRDDQKGRIDANGHLQGKWVKIIESHQGNSALDGFFENDQLIEGIKIGRDGTQYKVSMEKLEA